MKKIFKYLSLIIIFLITSNVYAIDECSTKEMNRLKELANNVKFTYSYQVEEESREEEFIIVLYKIEALNLSSDLRLSYDGKIVSANDIKNMSFYNRHQVFELYSYVDNLCTDELIKKVVVDLPTVNSYYYFNKEKCLENPDFKYCQEFLDIKDISYEKIDKLFQEYIKKDDNNSSKKNNNYLLYILIGISVAVIITITLVIKHRKNKEDL